MADHHCSVCGADAEEDRLSWCGNPECCSPSYLLPCGCPGALVCYGDDCDHAPTAQHKGEPHG